MIHNFPLYAWFDPMTAYPVGKSIDWGPLMIFIGSGLSLLFGMTTRPEMMYVASWILPIFAALTVPVVYLLGKWLWDYKVGLVSSGLITLLGSVYLIETSFGNFDHHGIETFFSAFFCLMYIITLIYSKENAMEFRRSSKGAIFTLLAFLTAVSYFLGYLNMPTIILFALIVGIYTFVQLILDVIRNNSIIYLLYTNFAIFSMIIILMVVFGVKQGGFSLQQYSIGQIFAIFFIIVETAVIFGLAQYFKQNKKFFFISVILSFAVLITIIQFFTNSGFISELVIFFGQSPGPSTITELKAWNLTMAFNSFSFALVLSIFGFGVLLHQIYRKFRNEHIFFAIWTVIVLIATIQHFRYEYYFVVNISLLSALGIVTGIWFGLKYLDPGHEGLWAALNQIIRKKSPSPEPPKPDKKKSKREKGQKSRRNGKLEDQRKGKIFGLIILIVISLMIVFTITASIQKDLAYTTNPKRIIDTNWVESMEWLSLNTPDPGVEYLSIYDRDDFIYPLQSYGILAWWDYGHYITFIGERISITNPFQDNLIGPEGAASFFLTESEENALSILEPLGGRYVITDTSTATEKFISIAEWHNPRAEIYPYMRSFFKKDASGLLQINGELPPYYRSTLVRLHNFDGSMIIPGKTIVLEYYNENRGGLAYPIITNAWLLTTDEAAEALAQFRPQPEGATDVVQVGQFLQPLEKIPALRHFRLVHESPGNSTNLVVYDISGIESIPGVKIFEAVPGARIKGEGTVELRIITNTGRTFIYNQESSNGEFLVPYSTIGNPYGVKAFGRYHIVGTGIEFDVNEEDLISGNMVEM